MLARRGSRYQADNASVSVRDEDSCYQGAYRTKAARRGSIKSTTTELEIGAESPE